MGAKVDKQELTIKGAINNLLISVLDDVNFIPSKADLNKLKSVVYLLSRNAKYRKKILSMKPKN